MKIKDANGVQGVLLNPYHQDGKWIFRTYNNDGTFIDYDLCHSDLCVIINDFDAALYEDVGGHNRLDHSAETFGIKEF